MTDLARLRALEQRLRVLLQRWRGYAESIREAQDVEAAAEAHEADAEQLEIILDGLELGDSTGSADSYEHQAGSAPSDASIRPAAVESPSSPQDAYFGQVDNLTPLGYYGAIRSVESPSSRDAELHELAEDWASKPAIGEITQRLAAYVLRLERERDSDAWHQGWKVAVKERDEARQENASLRWQLATFERETRARIETLKEVELDLAATREALMAKEQELQDYQGLRDGLATLPIVHSSEIADDPAAFHGGWIRGELIAALLEPKA